MKAGLVLISLSLVAFAQAKYDLSCAKSELSIRWPSYESNSEYYVCSRLYGRRMTVNCNPGEVFTFVLQSCTSPNRYIPAPAVEYLPRASPAPSTPNEDGFLTPVVIEHSPPALNPPALSPPALNPPAVSPPALSPPSPPTGDMPKLHPQLGPPTSAPVAIIEQHTPENGVPIVVETDAVTPPMPPTPAPTPPVVVKETSRKPGGKKPAAKKKKTTTSNKKTTAAKKETIKKPNAASGKKTTAQKKGKQNSKIDKAPKKSVKRPNTKDKKVQKEN